MTTIFSPDFRYALYVFCHDYHSGQWSRGYRLLSKMTTQWNPRNITSTLMEEIRETEEYLELENKYKDKI